MDGVGWGLAHIDRGLEAVCGAAEVAPSGVGPVLAQPHQHLIHRQYHPHEERAVGIGVAVEEGRER